MSSSEETNIETVKKMGINFALIIGVLALLVVASVYSVANISS